MTEQANGNAVPVGGARILDKIPEFKKSSSFGTPKGSKYDASLALADQLLPGQAVEVDCEDPAKVGKLISALRVRIKQSKRTGLRLRQTATGGVAIFRE